MKTLISVSSTGLVLFTTLSLFFISCEESKVDPYNLNTPKLNSSTIYVRSSSSALIDISPKISTSQQINFSITSSTNKGALSSLGNGLLQYSPNEGVANAIDAFSYTLTNKNNDVIKQDSVIIVVESDAGSLPDGVYPSDDILFGIAPNTTFTVDVLRNDIFSIYNSSDFKVSIYQPDAGFPPYAGTATISGSVITYSATSNFEETDKIIYKLELKSDPAVTAFGLVFLTSTPGCSFTLANDTFISNEAFTQLTIPVLGNDQLCTAVNSYSVVIFKQPVNGRAYIDSGLVVYEPSETAENDFTDSLQYQVTIDGISKIANVVVSVDTSIAGACQFTAVLDSIDLTNSTAGAILIDVLQNDVLCNAKVVLEIENNPLYGTASVVTDGTGVQKISYVPNALQVEDDKIIYRITAGDKSSVEGVAIKRAN